MTSSPVSKDKSSSSSSTANNNIQALNWAGSIPMVLTLAPSSLSSPTLPPPIHVLVSRQTFLHTGLEDAVRRLHQFAPTTVSFRAGLVRTEPDPGVSNQRYNDDDTTINAAAADNVSSGEGEEGKKETSTTPGAAQSTATDGSYNRNPVPRSSSSSSSPSSDTITSSPYPICWFEDEESQTALRWNLFVGVLYDLMNVQKRQIKEGGGERRQDDSSSAASSLIPWKIRLHFTAAYPTSQILPLDNNTCPLLMQVWNFYKNSLKQALCLQNGNSKAAMNLSKENHGRLWDAIRLDNVGLYSQVHKEQLSSSSSSRPKRLPTRILVDAQPPRQASSLYSDALTLGALLAQQLPNHFIIVKDEQHGSSSSPSAIIAKDDCVLDWSVAGIVRPSLEIPVATLWENLCHADHFLYIIVHTC
jgi:hypothetical protein